jgi:hypothetical protein
MPVVRHLVNEIEFRIGKDDTLAALKRLRGIKDNVNRIGKETDSFYKRKPANSSEFLGRMKAMQQSAISTNHTLGELGKTMNNLGGQAANNGVNQLRKNIRLAGEEAKKTSKEMHAAANPIIGGGGGKGGGGKTMAKMSGFSEVRGALGTAAFSYGAGNFLRSSLYEAYDMEDERSRYQKISGQDVSGPELIKYQEYNDSKNIEMSRKFGVSRKDVYTIQAALAEAGYNKAEQTELVNGMTESVMKAVLLFGLNNKEATDLVLGIVGKFQIKSKEELDRYISGLNLAEQKVPGGAKEVTKGIYRSGGTLGFMMSPEEIIATNALLTGLSSSTYMGATASRKLGEMISKTEFLGREAKGLEAMGFKVEETSKGVFKSKEWDKLVNEQGPSAAIMEILKRLRDVASQGEEGTPERRAAQRKASEMATAFFGTGLKTSNILKAAQYGVDLYNELLTDLNAVVTTPDGRKIKKTDAIMEIEEGRKMESVRKQMDILIVAWQNFKIAFVEDVLPFFTKILNNTLTPALYAFKKLPNIAKYILVFAVGLAALILPLMIIGSGLITLGTVLGWTGGAIVAAGVGVFGALTWLSEKITNGTDDFSIAARGFWNEFKQIISGVWEGIGGVGSWDEVKKNFEMVKDVLGTFFGWIWDYILEPILGWVNAIYQFFIGKPFENAMLIYQFFIGKPFENAMLNLFPAINGGKSPDVKQIYNQEQAKKRAENKIALESTEAQNLLRSYNVYNGKGQQNFSPIPANNTNNTNTNNITLNLSLPNNSDPQSTANAVEDALTNALALNR